MNAIPSIAAAIEATTNHWSPPLIPTGYAHHDPAYAWIDAHHFPELIDRLVDKEGWNESTAVAVWADLKRFLYLCGTRAPDQPRLSPPEVIDIAWHHFVMFTKQYATFCDDHFGAFVHHTPFTRQERARMLASRNGRATVTNAQDAAVAAFGELSAYWYAVGIGAGRRVESWMQRLRWIHELRR